MFTVFKNLHEQLIFLYLSFTKCNKLGEVFCTDRVIYLIFYLYGPGDCHLLNTYCIINVSQITDNVIAFLGLKM